MHDSRTPFSSPFFRQLDRYQDRHVGSWHFSVDAGAYGLRSALCISPEAVLPAMRTSCRSIVALITPESPSTGFRASPRHA